MMMVGRRVVFLLFVLVARAVSLSREHLKGEKCFEIEKTAPVDVKWMSSLKTQYYPLMSIRDLYGAALELLQEDFSDISHAQLFYDACIEFTGEENGYAVTGFGGRAAKMEWTPTSPTMEEIEFRLPFLGISGTCYNTLTDNSTFIFAACCGSDGGISWGVASTLKTLPEKTVTLIQDHALSLGFKKENFVELRYDTCITGGEDRIEQLDKKLAGCSCDNEIEN